jgi:peroxiredoxin
VQLVELQQVAGELARHGVAPFAISYDSVEALSAFAQKSGVEYPLLADEGSKAIRRLGMLDEDLDAHHAAMGGTVRDDQRGVCYPGVFLLDEQGVVRDRRFQRNYRVRESGLGLLEHALGISPRDAVPSATAESERVRITARLDSPTYWRYQRLRAMVEVEIAPGFHVYGPPAPTGYVPLGVEVAAEGAEVEQPRWPAGRPLQLDGLDEQLLAYEGTVRLAVPFEFIVQRGEPMGDRTVTVTVRYQTCDEGTCYPPETATLELLAKERPSVD